MLATESNRGKNQASWLDIIDEIKQCARKGIKVKTEHLPLSALLYVPCSALFYFGGKEVGRKATESAFAHFTSHLKGQIATVTGLWLCYMQKSR